MLEEELKARHEMELKELGPSEGTEPEAADRVALARLMHKSTSRATSRPTPCRWRTV